MPDINIEQTVREVLAQQLNMDVHTIKPDSRLSEDLGLDSFGAVEMAFALEEKFGLKISDDAVYTSKIVQDIVNYITTQISQKGQPA